MRLPRAAHMLDSCTNKQLNQASNDRAVTLPYEILTTNVLIKGDNYEKTEIFQEMLSGSGFGKLHSSY